MNKNLAMIFNGIFLNYPIERGTPSNYPRLLRFAGVKLRNNRRPKRQTANQPPALVKDSFYALQTPVHFLHNKQTALKIRT
jgi:hypothetical protein